MRTLISIIETISLWSGRIAALLLVPLVFAMVYEVVSRYVFSAPTQWAFEISYMLMGTIFTLGLSYCLRNDAHVNVDILPSLLPARVNAVIEVMAFGGLTVLLVWLTITLGEGVARTYRTGEGSGLSAWNPKVWPFRLVYTVGFALFSLQVFGRFLEALLVLSGGKPPSHPDATVDEKAGAA
ncbi:MAG: TRAP transporter small permease subunit [Rhodobacteraceae bacterium]|uniref:TRAP transporter small permease subunit n=1 Tax=Salipiger sp. HF18 TaxID=2721557 RepID=UPI00142DA60D|nr:TRAP transporter small permease subunit [Salipiger sp. HF18]NIY94926.1 TRAP transporter small permease subunit [Salipiger sp. HF18]NVK59990.1 TRAP transporter small permease subunit [Paracoccaceae bacterium]